MSSEPLSTLAAPSSRSSLAAEAVRAAILSGRYKPGHHLVERELAELLGVSKTPVREALLTLSRTGLVEQAPYRRMRVKPVTEGLIRSVYEARLLVEPAAIAQAVPHVDDALTDKAAELLETGGGSPQNAQDEGKAQLQLANRQFHQLLYARCGNDLLRGFLQSLEDQVALISVAGWMQRPTWERERKEHRAMLDAVARRDAEAARALTREHIGAFFEQVLNAWQTDGGQR